MQQNRYQFDDMTRSEIQARMEENDAIEKRHKENVLIVNTITVAFARWCGAGPNDIVKLNEDRSGIIVDLVPTERQTEPQPEEQK